MTALLHYEDYPPGATKDFGRYEVTRDEVIAFAREFDPQPFHLDDEAAKSSVLGGLAASGWHVCAMLMRMMVDGHLGETAGMGSPGLEEVRWLKPVYPGEVLTARYKVLSARVSSRKPDVGLISMLWEALGAEGEVKCAMTGTVMVKVRRP